MTTANSAVNLAKAGAIYSIASNRISNSSVPLVRTRAGRLSVDLAEGALRADRLVVDIRMHLAGDFKSQSPKLLNAEMKIQAECRA